jgi:hypothetical protein
MVTRTAASKNHKPVPTRGSAKVGRGAATGKLTSAAIAMKEARRAGLLDGDRTEHLSFRAPKALIDAARRESGASGPTELGLLALAMLAQPDPTAKFLKEMRGKLGVDHQLEY